MSEDFKKLEVSIVDLNKKAALEATNKIIDEKQDPKSALDAVTKALDEIGKLYEKEEYYLKIIS